MATKRRGGVRAQKSHAVPPYFLHLLINHTIAYTFFKPFWLAISLQFSQEQFWMKNSKQIVQISVLNTFQLMFTIFIQYMERNDI